MQQMIVINDQEVKFEVQDGQVFATSLSVAKVFSKNHKHIIAKIDEYSDEVKDRTKIRPISYFDSYGREQKAYELTRDAFSFLVMGFTGSKADKWKLDFIDAFNKMEAHIRNNHIPPRPETKLLSPMEMLQLQFEAHKELDHKVELANQRLDTLEGSSAFTASDCFRYQTAVKAKAHKLIIENNLSEFDKPAIFAGIHGDIKRYYGVASYKDLPHYKLDEVLERVDRLSIKQRVGA
ncbi:MAG: Rha family transcriptional regulator [Sulfurimonas sp.]|nr:Rha family transcriptional regulator [Sulfurimonas sp.]